MSHVTKEELQVLQSMNSEFQKVKMMLGDIELEKHAVLKKVDSLRNDFAAYENTLIGKYGQVTINLQTGEITKKENG